MNKKYYHDGDGVIREVPDIDKLSNRCLKCNKIVMDESCKDCEECGNCGRAINKLD